MRSSDWSSDVCSSDLLVQQVRDGLAGRQGDVGDRGRPIEALLHRAESADICPLTLGDGPDGGVVLGPLDLPARRDSALDIAQPLVCHLPSVVSGTRVTVCLDFGCCRIIKKKKT